MKKYFIIAFLMAQGFANDTTSSGQTGEGPSDDVTVISWGGTETE